MAEQFMGLDGFIWWQGIVEDRQDPLQLGRCRVRIFGWHNKDTAILPTADLPWAMPMLPLNNTTPKPPKEGDFVVGWFLDGMAGQQPVMMGVVPGIPRTNTRD